MLCVSVYLPHSLLTPTRAAVFVVHAILKLTLRILLFTQLVMRPSRKDPLVPNTNMGNLYLLPRTQIAITFSSHKRTVLWNPDFEAFRPDWWFEPALLDKVATTPSIATIGALIGIPRVKLVV